MKKLLYLLTFAFHLLSLLNIGIAQSNTNLKCTGDSMFTRLYEYEATNGTLKDFHGVSIGTLQDFLEDKVQYVTIAVDIKEFHNSISYGTPVCIPKFNQKFGKNIAFQIRDTRSDLYGLGLSRLAIAVRTKTHDQLSNSIVSINLPTVNLTYRQHLINDIQSVNVSDVRGKLKYAGLREDINLLRSMPDNDIIDQSFANSSSRRYYNYYPYYPPHTTTTTAAPPSYYYPPPYPYYPSYNYPPPPAPPPPPPAYYPPYPYYYPTTTTTTTTAKPYPYGYGYPYYNYYFPPPPPPSSYGYSSSSNQYGPSNSNSYSGSSSYGYLKSADHVPRPNYDPLPIVNAEATTTSKSTLLPPPVYYHDPYSGK